LVKDISTGKTAKYLATAYWENPNIAMVQFLNEENKLEGKPRISYVKIRNLKLLEKKNKLASFNNLLNKHGQDFRDLDSSSTGLYDDLPDFKDPCNCANEVDGWSSIEDCKEDCPKYKKHIENLIKEEQRDKDRYDYIKKLNDEEQGELGQANKLKQQKDLNSKLSPQQLDLEDQLGFGHR